MESRTVYHPQFGAGTLLKTYMGGYEWEVLFQTGRRFRLPAKEFMAESVSRYTDPATFRPPFKERPVIDSDQFRARQTLEALRVGIVPVQDAETLTIGLEMERVTLNRALDRGREQSGDVIAVIGNYGFGKSHFIEIAARRALRQNFLVASASLDLMEVPPNKANKIYEALVTSMRYPDTNERGLRPLLQKVLERPALIDQFTALSPLGVIDCPVAAALNALRDCPSQTAFDEIVIWLSGQNKPTPELRTCLKKPPRLYLAGDVARQYSYLLSAISALATLVGYSGMTILIDESEHYSLLRTAGRERASAFFKALIVAALGINNGRINAQEIPDHPRMMYPVAFSTESHLVFLFAMTESEDRMPVGTWLAPSHLVRLDDRFIEKDIAEFFHTLLRYHALAYDYGYPPSVERYGDIAQSAPGLLARALAQHRINLRQVIRDSVAVCDLLYLHNDYAPAALLEELERGLKVS